MLGNIGQQLAVFNESLAQLASRAFEGMRLALIETVVKSTQVLAESWRPVIAGFASAVEAWAEQQRELDGADPFVRRHGWPLPTSIPSASYHRVV